jgi:hypothetical protein
MAVIERVTMWHGSSLHIEFQFLVKLTMPERVMQGFRSVGGLQRFISVFSAVRNHFVPSHQKHSALATHVHRIRAMAQWKAVTGATA